MCYQAREFFGSADHSIRMFSKHASFEVELGTNFADFKFDWQYSCTANEEPNDGLEGDAPPKKGSDKGKSSQDESGRQGGSSESGAASSGGGSGSGSGSGSGGNGDDGDRDKEKKKPLVDGTGHLTTGEENEDKDGSDDEALSLRVQAGSSRHTPTDEDSRMSIEKETPTKEAPLQLATHLKDSIGRKDSSSSVISVQSGESDFGLGPYFRGSSLQNTVFREKSAQSGESARKEPEITIGIVIAGSLQQPVVLAGQNSCRVQTNDDRTLGLFPISYLLGPDGAAEFQSGSGDSNCYFLYVGTSTDHNEHLELAKNWAARTDKSKISLKRFLVKSSADSSDSSMASSSTTDVFRRDSKDDSESELEKYPQMKLDEPQRKLRRSASEASDEVVKEAPDDQESAGYNLGRGTQFDIFYGSSFERRKTVLLATMEHPINELDVGDEYTTLSVLESNEKSFVGLVNLSITQK